MLRRLRNRMLSWFSSLPDQESSYTEVCEKERPDSDHYKISRKLISDNALKVLQRLDDHGYEAYLVGGCIRDILLGIRPKDFDIATNAHPEQVRKLFRNSRIIGRRFRLIHIMFGREIIEVATFRACHKMATHQDHMIQDSNSGRILRDNVYGAIEEDAARRDFTVNALYYKCTEHEQKLIDFSTGLEDLNCNRLRLLGDPEVRYREDPVRMLRAIRFSAKLNFSIADETAAPIRRLSFLLKDIPAARLFDEISKLFLCGHGLQSLALLQEYELFGYLFPEASTIMAQKEQALLLFKETLRSTDDRVHNELPVTPAFLYASLLWHVVLKKADELKGSDEMTERMAMQKAFSEAINRQSSIIAIPKRFTLAIREIWDLQYHLVKHYSAKIKSIVSHPRFRAAYDLLLMRETSGENLNNAGAWWTHYQKKNPVRRNYTPRRSTGRSNYVKHKQNQRF